jgi:hypothetical protein
VISTILIQTCENFAGIGSFLAGSEIISVFQTEEPFETNDSQFLFPANYDSHVGLTVASFLF